jgi:hypothetical protein
MVGAKLNEMHDPERRKKANPNRQRKDKDVSKPKEEPILETENLVHA